MVIAQWIKVKSRFEFKHVPLNFQIHVHIYITDSAVNENFAKLLIKKNYKTLSHISTKSLLDMKEISSCELLAIYNDRPPMYRYLYLQH